LIGESVRTAADDTEREAYGNGSVIEVTSPSFKTVTCLSKWLLTDIRSSLYRTPTQKVPSQENHSNTYGDGSVIEVRFQGSGCRVRV
jgi:hypothetical protein